LPLHSNSIGKSPHMDLGLTDTESESDDDDGDDLITTPKAQELRNLKKVARERRQRGLREREIPDASDLELVRASKKQKREERKIELEKEREEKAQKAEVQRLLKATARENMPQTKRDIERCMDILPQTWKKGARRNVINRVKEEMSKIWPISDATEVTDREVTELIKIWYLPLNMEVGVPMAQYHALQMTTEPGEEEGKTIRKMVLLKRLNPKWMEERFDPKFL
jgi:hypothetical protein